MIEIKQFWCGFETPPSDEEIRQAVAIANSEQCAVRLLWTMKWSGKYQLHVYPGDTFEECVARRPRVYGV